MRIPNPQRELRIRAANAKSVALNPMRLAGKGGMRFMAEKRILILSEAFGYGHTKAAEAIAAGVKLKKPDWKVDVVELGAWLRPRLTQLVTGAYVKTLRYSPRIWGVMYRRSRMRTVKPKFEYLLHRLLYSQVAGLLREYRPDLIVCTHPFPSAVISRMKRMGFGVPLFTVITDYGLHGSWVSSGVDRYFLPSAHVFQQMLQLGIPENHLYVTGIPIHPKFWSKQEKPVVREKLGLADRLTLLCMGGGLGIGLNGRLLEMIYGFREELQVLWVTGRNEKMYQMLKESQYFDHPHFHVYPFVHNIDELMDASDLLLTKPGGVTCSEAMAKGVPMLFFNPIPGQEEENCRYMMEHGLGFAVSDLAEMESFLLRFIESPGRFAAARPYAAGGQGVIEFIVNLF